MKKDIEWLKKEIATEMIELELNRKERWSDVRYQTLRNVAQKIYQLDEPEKPVIPQFVATFIEDARNKVGCIVTAIWEMYEYEYKRVYEWALEDGNDEVLMKAFANGYEVEKEKLYYVEIIKGESYLCQEPGGRIWVSNNGLGIEADYKGKMRFTEVEIKAIDERYWQFAVEVAE